MILYRSDQPQVKRNVISSTENLVYKLPHELPNDLRLRKGLPFRKTREKLYGELGTKSLSKRKRIQELFLFYNIMKGLSVAS